VFFNVKSLMILQYFDVCLWFLLCVCVFLCVFVVFTHTEMLYS
jgi:hypothetical protein